MARAGDLEPPPDDRIPLSEVEAVVRSVPGVERAKVVVNDWGAIESIHVIGDTSRPAKRVVRDIESALAAKIGILVDHRRISLAQVNTQEAPAFAPRLALAGYTLEVDSAAGRAWVTVRLGRSDRPEALYQGVAEARGGGSGMRNALVQAAAAALEQALPEAVRIDPGQVRSVREGEHTIWVCTLIVARSGREEVCAGAAVEAGSREEAVLRAVLDAAARASEGLELRDPEAAAEAAAYGERADGEDGEGA
ncbi:MAG: hypothetical protein K6V73_05330 [Firmicutes bacterium]|nr:hypothetical protein [Bacillota bacterium]